MRWGFLAAVLLLAACGGGGGGGGVPGVVSVTCGYVNNDGEYNQCTDVGLALLDWLAPEAVHALTGETLNIDAGDVVRGDQMINATLEVTNSTADAAWVWYELTFDGGCNGQPEWKILHLQLSPQPIEAGDTWVATTGGQCGDMPLGARMLTAVAYEDVAGTPGPEIGRVVVSFNLVELIE